MQSDIILKILPITELTICICLWVVEESLHRQQLLLLFFFFSLYNLIQAGVMGKVLDGSLEATEFKLQFSYYIDFRTDNLEKDINPLILPQVRVK